MEEVDQDSRRANKDMRKQRRIYFSEISRKQTVLCIVSMTPGIPAATQIPTLAISSVFLNSPLTRVTFPSSLNSVQRNFNSFTFVALLRPRLVPVPFTSSRRLGSGGGPSDFGTASGFRRRSILCRNGRESVEANREEHHLSFESLDATSPA